MTKIDILAIGDITTDAFIRIKDATVDCDVDSENCKLCVKFGDKIPYESVDIVRAVGNSANASVSSARLGLHSALLAYIGNDQNGKECKEELERNNVDTTYVRVEDGKNTNYHYVLWYDVERTILVKHETFSYKLGDIDHPKWIYLSSLGENSLPYHLEIADFIEKNPETKLAFQPGTFQIRLGAKTLEKIYKNTEVFFCNVEEAQKILDEKTRDLPTLLSKMKELGPKIICITDGINGAYTFDGNKRLFVPIYPQEAFERTGAGDAFASTFISALAKGKTLEEAMLWGPINSMSVVKDVGAQRGLLSEEKLLDYLSKAPEDYKVKEI
ncbi:MAG: carbohydrate kinase family protein [Candidatus Paceibacterota bacterium]